MPPEFVMSIEGSKCRRVEEEYEGLSVVAKVTVQGG